MSQRLRQRAAQIVALYNEMLASTGTAQLTSGEREVDRHLVPPLVG